MKLNVEDMRGWCLGRRGEALSSKAVHTRCIVLPLQQGQKCQASFCGERSKSCFSTWRSVAVAPFCHCLVSGVGVKTNLCRCCLSSYDTWEKPTALILWQLFFNCFVKIAFKKAVAISMLISLFLLILMRSKRNVFVFTVYSLFSILSLISAKKKSGSLL